MKKILYGMIGLLIAAPLAVFSQTGIDPVINSTLSGKVVDSRSKQPLTGAVVQIKGTTHEVIADENGQFNFRTGQKLPYVLIVSYVGYETIEDTANKTVIEVLLKKKSKDLDAVVVIGYGNQERRTLTSAVSTIAVENIRNKDWCTVIFKKILHVAGFCTMQ
jgi:hypothetical protein